VCGTIKLTIISEENAADELFGNLKSAQTTIMVYLPIYDIISGKYTSR